MGLKSNQIMIGYSHKLCNSIALVYLIDMVPSEVWWLTWCLCLPFASTQSTVLYQRCWIGVKALYKLCLYFSPRSSLLFLPLTPPLYQTCCMAEVLIGHTLAWAHPVPPHSIMFYNSYYPGTMITTGQRVAHSTSRFEGTFC